MTYGSIKYKEEVKEFVTNIRKKDKLSVATFHKNQVSKGSESNYTENNIVTVRGHIRDLPMNYTASDQQRKLARENNVDLGANQTFVRKHEKNLAA